MEAPTEAKSVHRELVALLDELVRGIVTEGLAEQAEVIRARHNGSYRVVASAGKDTTLDHLSPTVPEGAIVVGGVGEGRWWVRVVGATEATQDMIVTMVRLAVENATHRVRVHQLDGETSRASIEAWLDRHDATTVLAIGVASTSGYLAIADRAAHLRYRCADLVGECSGAFAALTTECWIVGLPAILDHSELHVWLEGLRLAVADVCGDALEVGLRVGWTWTRDHDTSTDAITAALDALDVARASQTTEVVAWGPDLAHHMAKRRRVRNELPGALRRGEVSYALQPQVNVLTGAVTGAEALLRWEGHGTTDVVIELERNPRTSIQLDRHSLERVVALLERFPTITLSVNVSAPYVLDGLLTDCERLAVPEGRLVIEITEEVALRNLDVVADTVRWCQHNGIDVSLDDFGTANQSLAVLRALPVREIKVAREFVQDAMRSMNAWAIVAGLTELADRGNLRIIAEGVEHVAEAELWCRLGGSLIQGYLVGRPMPPESLAERLGEQPKLVLSTPMWDPQDRVLLEPHDYDDATELATWRERLAAWWLGEGADRFAHLEPVQALGAAIGKASSICELPRLVRQVITAIDTELAQQQFITPSVMCGARHHDAR